MQYENAYTFMHPISELYNSSINFRMKILEILCKKNPFQSEGDRN
jgi:hypothetical protein